MPFFCFGVETQMLSGFSHLFWGHMWGSWISPLSQKFSWGLEVFASACWAWLGGGPQKLFHPFSLVCSAFLCINACWLLSGDWSKFANLCLALHADVLFMGGPWRWLFPGLHQNRRVLETRLMVVEWIRSMWRFWASSKQGICSVLEFGIFNKYQN
jgi:hypothetical protein